MRKEYTSVSLPKEFIEQIDKLIEETDLGYTSRPEFVKDSVRRHLERYKYFKKQKQIKKIIRG